MSTTALVTGGAGFLGSHLCDLLLAQGRRVICVDNLETGSARNVEHNLGRADFAFVRHDVVEPLDVAEDVDVVYHLATPASPTLRPPTLTSFPQEPQCGSSRTSL